MSDATSPCLLLVEDHMLMAQTLSQALGLMGFQQVHVAQDLSVDGVLRAAKDVDADIVLLDLHLGPRVTSIPMIGPLVASGAGVMMLTASRDLYELAECIEAGAIGIFDKGQPFEELIEFIHDACTGRTVLEPDARDALLASLRDHRDQAGARALPFESLTAKEGEVFALIVDGKPADVISNDLFISVATVRSHVRAILRKLGVNSQLAAVVLAQHAGWKPDGG